MHTHIFKHIWKHALLKSKVSPTRSWTLCHALQPPECAFLVAQRLERLPAMWETWVRSLGQEDTLEKEMATHSSILAWRIPWVEEPGGLQSTGLLRVGHDWVSSLSAPWGLCLWMTAQQGVVQLYPVRLGKPHLEGWPLVFLRSTSPWPSPSLAQLVEEERGDSV